MNLQAKLTLCYVLLAVLMVTIISAVDLGNDMQAQFEATLNGAECCQQLGGGHVGSQALNRSSPVTVARSAARPGAGRISCKT